MANCVNCGNIENYTCTCTDPTVCTCKFLVSALCVIYQGAALSNIPVNTGDNLELILQRIDTKISEIITLINSGLVVNIGTGANIFKQVNAQGQAELRSLVSGDSSITITENADEIDFAVAPGVLGETNTASNLGAALGLFKQKVGSDLQFRSINAGANITIVQDVPDEIFTISATDTDTTYTASNIGLGTGNVFAQLNGTDFEFKTLLQGTGITITETANTITIAATGGTGTITGGTNLGGGAEVFAQVNGANLEFKTITAGNAIQINETATEIEIVNTAVPSVLQIERTASFSLDNTMNGQVVMINNGATNITVTVPPGLMDDLVVGFERLGTGTVTFVAGAGATLNAPGGMFDIDLQYDNAMVTKRNAGTNQYILNGNLA